MRIVIAPDSFKGCLTASQVCDAVEAGLRAARPEISVTSVPMADGGEGTVQSLVEATGGHLITVEVEGPLGDPVQASFGVLGDGETAAIEMAEASGLTLLPDARRDPTLTTTFGTGQLMRAALDEGCRKLIVGIGGSATTDGGAGMAQALGARFFDDSGQEIERVSGGRLAGIARIDKSGVDPRLAETEVRVACDVGNPLYGETGAAHVYGPQKGASPEMVELLDAGLRAYAARLAEDVGATVADVPGAGAAGGLGAGLMAFCGAHLESGVAIVIDAVSLREKVRGADLVITGEGRIDFQTAFGKTPSGVADVANEFGVPVVALGGSVALDAASLHEKGFGALMSIMNEPMTLDDAMDPDKARELLAFAGEQILRLVSLREGI